MLTPLSWLKDYVDIDVTPKELEEKLHQQELEKLEIKHELEIEKNKSIWKKIFKK